jgi:hypothetical protein
MTDLTRIPIHERLISIIATEDTKKQLSERIDWKKLGKDYLLGGGILKIGFKVIKSIKNSENALETYRHNQYPILNIDAARKCFKFPPTHPKDGVVYATSEIDPNLYIPLSSFHNYMYESKMSAFNEMCAYLGAKTCKIIYAEENEKDITSEFMATNIPTNLGILNSKVDFHSKNTHGEEANIFFSFPKTKEISEYSSNWLQGEPTWKTLQKLRLEKDIKTYIAEFSYYDEMGIDAKVANSFNNVGVNIGGTFNEIVKKKFKFEVEFWSKQ